MAARGRLIGGGGYGARGVALAVLAAVALVAARGAAPAHGALADLRATVQCAVENAASFSKRGPSVRIEAGDFSDYGCFCGLEGVAVAKSGTPVDAIDECCRAHHECWRAVDAAHGNAGGRVRECSLAPHFLSCDAGAEDASAAMKCYDFEANPIQRLRGTIGDACCDCDRNLGRCIATRLKNAETAYAAKYRDWSDADMRSLAKLGGPYAAAGARNATAGAPRVCGPDTPSFARRMHGILTGLSLLGRAGDAREAVREAAGVAEGIGRDYWQNAEQRTVEAAEAAAERGVDSLLHGIDDWERGPGAEMRAKLPSLYDITSSAAGAQDTFLAKIDAFDADAAGAVHAFAERAKDQAETAKKWMSGAIGAYNAGKAWMDGVKAAYNPKTWKDAAARFKAGGKAPGSVGGDGNSIMDIYDRIAPLLRDMDAGEGA